MKSLIPWMLVVVLAMGWYLDRSSPLPAEAHAETLTASLLADGQAFDLHALMAEREASGRPWLQFLKEPTLFMGVYAIPKDGTDRQQPHDLDEVYYIAQGQANLVAGDSTFAVQPGSIVYVKANVEHRFESITEDLQTLVFFSEAKPE